MHPFSARMVAVAYDVTHNGTIVAVVTTGGVVCELFEGVVRASTSDFALLPANSIRSLHTSSNGTLLIGKTFSCWLYSRLRRRVDCLLDDCRSSCLIENRGIFGVCESKEARILSLESGETLWRADGCYATVSICCGFGHIALSQTSGSVSVFISHQGVVSPCAMVVKCRSIVERIEWVQVQSDSILAIFSCHGSKRTVDLYCLVSEPPDAMCVGRSDPTAQVVHSCSVPFTNGGMPRVLRQHPSCPDSFAPRLSFLCWESGETVRWCSYRFSQHSVPHHDVGGVISCTSALTSVFDNAIAPVVWFEVFPTLSERNSLLTHGNDTKSVGLQSLVAMQFANGLILVAHVDASSGKMRVEQLICEGNTTEQNDRKLIDCGRFVVRVSSSGTCANVAVYHLIDSSTTRLVAISCDLEIPKREVSLREYLEKKLPSKASLAASFVKTFGSEAAALSQLKRSHGEVMPLDGPLLFNATATQGSIVVACGMNNIIMFNCVAGVYTLLNRSSNNVPEMSASTTLNCCVGLKIDGDELHISYEDKSTTLNVPQWICASLESCVVVVSTYLCSGIVFVALVQEKKLACIRWDTLLSGPATIREFHSVEAYCLLHNKSLLFCSSDILNCFRWSDGGVTTMKLGLVGIAALATCIDSIVISCLDGLFTTQLLSSTEKSISTELTQAIHEQRWSCVSQFFENITTIANCPPRACLQIVHEYAGGDLAAECVKPPQPLSWVPIARFDTFSTLSETKVSIIEDHVYGKVSETLLNCQFQGLSTTEQTELICVVDSLRGANSLLSSLRDRAASRFILDSKIRDTRRKLKLPGCPISAETALWASMSDAQDVILRETLLKCQAYSWSEVCDLKVPSWIKSIITLKQIAEGVARAQYQASKEIRDCALMYCLAGKRQTLVALCKAANDVRLQQFFSRDFDDEKNKSAATSNAFVAVGKGNILFGAAFFVLGGDHKSAAQIVMDRLGDLQLALMIIRLGSDDDSASIKWLHGLLLEKHDSQLTPYDSGLLQWRAGENIEAMKTVRDTHDSRYTMNAWDILSYAKSQVTVLSRRSHEFLDDEEELKLLIRALRNSLSREDESATRIIQDNLKRKASQIESQSAEMKSDNNNAPAQRIESSVNFAAGTIHLWADDDDDCGDFPMPAATLAARPVDATNTITSEGISTARACDLNACHRIATMRFVDLCEKRCLQSVVPMLVNDNLFPDPHLVDGGAFNITEQQLDQLLSELINLPDEINDSQSQVWLPAILLLLMQWARDRLDFALGFSLLTVSAVVISRICGANVSANSSTQPMKAVISELLTDVAQAKLQTMSRGYEKLSSCDMSHAAGVSRDSKTLGAGLMHLTTAKLSLIVLEAIATRAIPLCCHTLELCYRAVSLLSDSEDFVFVHQMNRPRDEIACAAARMRAARGTVVNYLLALSVGRSEADLSFQQYQLLRGHIANFLQIAQPEHVPKLIANPPSGGLEKSAWLSELHDIAVVHPTADELLAQILHDEHLLRSLEFGWAISNHRILETRRFLVESAIQSRSALAERSLLFTGDHAVVSIAVDNSTCDNVAIATSSGISISHGQREILAGDNDYALSRRATERNAAMQSFADCFAERDSGGQRLSRVPLRAVPSATLVSHPHLPFFLSLSKDGFIDLFSFGDEDCVASMHLEQPGTSWCTPKFSLNGYFVTVGSRYSGDIVAWKFEDVVLSTASSDTTANAKRVKSFQSSCTALTHMSPYASIVLAGGYDTVTNAKRNAKSASLGLSIDNQFQVKVVDTFATRSVLLSCNVSHSVDYIVFDDAKRQSLCISEKGEMSIYDLRQNGIVATSMLVLPAATQKRKAADFSLITAVEACHDDVVAVGLSDGHLLMLDHVIPVLGQSSSDDGLNDMIRPAAMANLAFGTGREVSVTALVGTPSSVLFGLSDGRVGSTPLIPEQIRRDAVAN